MVFLKWFQLTATRWKDTATGLHVEYDQRPDVFRLIFLWRFPNLLCELDHIGFQANQDTWSTLKYMCFLYIFIRFSVLTNYKGLIWSWNIIFLLGFIAFMKAEHLLELLVYVVVLPFLCFGCFQYLIFVNMNPVLVSNMQ